MQSPPLADLSTGRGRVLIVDDHALVREGLRHILEGAPTPFDVLEAGGGAEALEILQQHPADVVTVAVLLIVAAVCSQLAASVRLQARLASAHAARNATIAGFSRRLLPVRYEAEVAQVGAGQLAEIFACHVAVLVDADDARAIAVVPGSSSLSPSDLAAASYTLQSGERSGRGERRSAQADWQFHPISSGDEVLAALGLARDDGTAPIGEERTQRPCFCRVAVEAADTVGLDERDVVCGMAGGR